ncbi:MAG: ATP-binding protein [Clostridiaceae bacterium]|nr:ATP-binding protein [Clostridiaceae bacterium]
MNFLNKISGFFFSGSQTRLRKRTDSQRVSLGYQSRRNSAEERETDGTEQDLQNCFKSRDATMQLEEEEYSLDDLVCLAEQVREKAEAKNLRFELSVEEGLPKQFCGDIKKIMQILKHLLYNAVKYTDAGTVSLRLAEEYRKREYIMLRVEIEDTGIGIRREELEGLLQSMRRVGIDNPPDTDQMGLITVKWLLEQMEANIELESIYQTGSKITLYIPQQVLGSERTAEKDASGTSEHEKRKTRQCSKPYQYLLIEIGMRYSGQLMPNYRGFLQMFSEEDERRQTMIEEAYRDENWKKYTLCAKALKSASLVLGGQLLSQAAEDAERAGNLIQMGQNREEMILYIKSHHQKLMELYHGTVQEVRRYLSETA